MPRVLVPLAEGFEEIEASTIVDVLRRAGIEVVVAGIAGIDAVRGSRGMAVVPDVAWADVDGEFDLVVLPGGMGGTLRLAAHRPLLEMLRERVAAERPVAAICAAPLVLDAAGVLEAGAFTCYPGIEQRLGTRGRRDDVVVDAGTVVTSQGPGTAMAFALHLVGRLAGEDVRADVAAGALVP